MKQFVGSLYRPSDICQIVHLIDTDGAYIPAENVVEDHAHPDEEYPYYEETQILTPKPANIVQRNLDKKANIEKLIATKWPVSAQKRYNAILKQADFITYISREYSKSCMLDRNRRLVESAVYLLAVYNGEWRGGTAATIRYAQKLGRTITVIDPAARRVTAGLV